MPPNPSSAAPQSLSPPPLGDAPRDLVVQRLAAQARHFPDLDIAELETSALPPRDAAFAHAIHDAVIRRWLTLSYLLDCRLSTKMPDLEPPLRAILLAGAAQLLLLDRVPPHAAINHAVEWAKQRIRPGAGAMVNAVLRKVAALRAAANPRPRWTDLLDELPLPDGSALPLSEPILPDNELTRLSVTTSTPRSLLHTWSAAMPTRDVRALALHGLADPPIILNTAHAQVTNRAIEVCSETSMLPATDDLSKLLTPHSAPGHHLFTGTHEQLLQLLRSRSDLWVQDPASSLAVGSAAGLQPNLILDLCAGQGTKTRQLAATFPSSRIAATDTDSQRLATLRHVFAGSDQVRVFSMPELRDRFAGREGGADLILLDVPCSNTGVLARRPEAKYRFDPEHLDSITNVQRQIIADAIPFLAGGPGGGSSILYSTCSLQREENQDQAGPGGWAVKWHGLKTAREHRRLPTGGPGLPAHDYTDGSYAVLLS